MVIAKAAPAACGSELRVPNVLFRIWTGVCCPPLLDFVSLLVAVLQLRPERIEYLLTPRMPANLTALRGFDGEVGRCFAALGNVNLVRLNFSTGSPLRLATSGFHAWDSGFWANGAPTESSMWRLPMCFARMRCIHLVGCTSMVTRSCSMERLFKTGVAVLPCSVQNRMAGGHLHMTRPMGVCRCPRRRAMPGTAAMRPR